MLFEAAADGPSSAAQQPRVPVQGRSLRSRGRVRARRDDVTVTPINPHPAFVDRARSCNKVAGGSHDAVVDYREIPGEGDFAVVDGTLIPAAVHTLLTCQYTE